LAILNALEKLQILEVNDRTVIISTDSRITLESLRNRKNHAYLIEKIRKKVIEIENQNWKIEFHWIKAHAGHHGKELADQRAKEAAINSDINECYTRTPKNIVMRE
jgi:ribonuclease HI